jgi:hypothetical protein
MSTVALASKAKKIQFGFCQDIQLELNHKNSVKFVKGKGMLELISNCKMWYEIQIQRQISK